MASIIHLSTLLDIMIMMLLDHLGLSQMTVTLINLIKIKQHCLLWLKINNF